MRTGHAGYVFSQIGNWILDELLYYFSSDFAEIRELVSSYNDKNLKRDENAFKTFRRRLLNIDWSPRKVHAFLIHWLDYAYDKKPEEEDMDFNVALKDRTVDCEEHRTIANALLSYSGYPAHAINIYYIPDDPEEEAKGHATKVIRYEPTAVTLCNWGLINHYESDIKFIRDFIPNANYYDKLEGRWEGEDFIQEYTEEGELEETCSSMLFSEIHNNFSEFMISPKKFQISSLMRADADYMKAFIKRRNALIDELQSLSPKNPQYGKLLREIKVRNQLLRRPEYSMKKIKVVP